MGRVAPAAGAACSLGSADVPRVASGDSIFSQLCRQTGGQYELLRAAALRHHETMQALQARLASADRAAASEARAEAAPAVVVKVAA